MFKMQESQVQLNSHNRSPNSPIQLKGQKEIAQDPVSALIHGFKFDENSQRLEIRGGVVVSSFKFQQQMKTKNSVSIKQKKKNGVNTKIHSIQKDVLDENSNSQEIQMNDLDQKVFSIKKYSEQLKTNCREIIIQDSRVNIYALKKLVRIVSKNVINLQIQNCRFYEGDNSTILDKKLSTNNKMLKELSFAFHIKSLQLPQIENIDIILLQQGDEVGVESEQSNKIVPQQAANEEKERKLLTEQYNCKADSSMVDFELKQKKKLEQHINKFKSQQEIANYIIHGNLSNNRHIDDCINDNIINDIHEHIHAFTKYIKDSLINKNTFLVKGYCLEDPIAFIIVQNVMIKNQEKIKTVIFKETGTIPNENFFKMIDLLVNMSSLESIAFFDAQPSFEPKPYLLLKELNDLKTFKYIVLNRSSFDLTGYQNNQIQQENNNKQNICNNKKVFSHEINPTPQHYAFYILDAKDKTKELYQFTPYGYCVSDLLYPQQAFANEKEQEEAILQYKIGHLIKKQRDIYPKEINQLIEIFQNEQILTYTGIIEQLISKYPIKKIQPNEVKLNQIELESDIRTLIKHSNFYSISFAKQILKKLTSTPAYNSFKFQCNLFKEDMYITKFDDIDLNNIFMKQQSITPNIIQGYNFKKQFLSNGFPKKPFSSVLRICKNSTNTQKLMKINKFDIDRFMSSIQSAYEIQLEFFEKRFQIVQDVSSMFVQESIINVLVNYTFDGTREQIFLAEEFLKILQLIFSKFNLRLSLRYEIEDENLLNICLSHLELLSKIENIKLQKLYLKGKGNTFNFKQTFSLFPIKEFSLEELKLDYESYKDITCSFNIETIRFCYCIIQSFDYFYFNNLKEIIMYSNEVEESVIQKLLFDNNTKLLNSSINSEAIVYLYFKRTEINAQQINTEMISKIIQNQTKEFAIGGINDSTYEVFKEEILKLFPSKLNPHLLQKFQGKKNAHCFWSLEKNGKLEQKQNLSNLQQDLDQNMINKQQQMVSRKLDNQIQKCLPNFSIITETYSHSRDLDLQVEMILQVTKIFRKCEQYISKCCTELLSNLLNPNFKGKSMSLLEQIKQHNGEFCFFKTSVFSIPFKPKSIQIRFFNNFLIKNSDQFLKDEKMEWIEEIDIRNQNINNQLQVQFINLLIQLSPRLQKLSFQRIRVYTQDDNQQHFITPLTSHKELKHLKLVDMSYSSRHLYVDILEAVLNSESVEILEQLSLKGKYTSVNIIDKISQILQKCKNTLKVLKMSLVSQGQLDILKDCTNIEKLEIWCNKTTISLFQVNEMKQVNHLTICLVVPQINQQILDSLLKSTLQNQSNIQQIIIRYQNQEQELKDNKFAQNQRENEKWPKYENYCLEKEQINNSPPLKTVMIQINQFIQVVQQRKGIEEEEINLKKYILENKGLSIKQLTIPLIEATPTILQKPNLQELHINQQSNYIFLNKIFEIYEDCLRIISFDDCNLDNTSLNGVDFGRLPTTIRKFRILGSNNLTSLTFLEPLLLNIEQYNNMVLDVYYTQIPLQQILKYQPHLKRIDHSLVQLWQLFKPLISQINLDINSSVDALQFIDQMIKDNFLDSSEIGLLLKLFFHSKVSKNPDNMKQISPFFFSPLQITQMPIQQNAKQELQNVYAKQKEDEVFSFKKRFGNKYLFYICQLVNKSQQFILSYSKNYHDNYFHLGKLRNILNEENEANFNEREHIFYDYLLLDQLHEKFNLKQVILPISLEISQSLLKNRKLNTNIDELTMVEHFSQIPPSELIIDNMSIQFIKTWYVISTIYPLSQKTQIQNIDSDAIYNNSIGNYLTQNLHRNNFIRSILSGNSRKYRFDETVQFLAQHLDNQIAQNKQTYLLLLFPLYQFVCMFGVIFFSLHFEVTCGKGISWYSYYSYLIYGFITLWIELLLFKKCLNYISHLIPSIEIDLNPNFIISFINFIKQSIIDTPWINQWYMGYSYSFFQSQIARFDNFTNVGFLYSTYQCGDYAIFYIALSSMSIPFLYSIFQFFRLIFKPNKKYSLPTASLDTYYNICNIIEFRAVSDILDLVSPSNVIILKGKMFNARIISYFIRIVCESMPLVIIQIYNLTKITMTSSLVVSLILSIITFLSLTISVLTITPSTLNQEDFNQLSEKKKKDRVTEKYEERLSTIENEIFVLRFYDHLKKLRINYQNQQKQGDISSELENQYKQNEKYFEKLFDSPKELESLLNVANEGEQKLKLD